MSFWDPVKFPSRQRMSASSGWGKNAQIIDSFGYSLQLNGQERTYNGVTYKGIYFGGSEELALNLPSKTLDIFTIDNAIKLGAFGGANENKDTVYLGIGANGIVEGKLQIPSSLGIPFLSGLELSRTDIDLIVGGQTTFPVRNANVSESMEQAFKNVDVYLGAMAGVDIKIIDARVGACAAHCADQFPHGRRLGYRNQVARQAARMGLVNKGR